MTYSFLAPARVRVGVVPLHDASKSLFRHDIAQIIEGGSEVRLLDLPPMPHLRYFNPQLFPTGHILFDFVTGNQPDTLFLEDFEPSRKLFVLIGIGSKPQESDERVLDDLKSKHPACILYNTIYFDENTDKLSPLEQNLDKNEHKTNQNGDETKQNEHEINHNKYETHQNKDKINSNGKAPFTDTQNLISSQKSPHLAHTNVFTLSQHNIQTIMCGVAANFLAALDTYASSFTSITLRSPVDTSVNSSHLSKSIAKAQKRISLGLLKGLPDAKTRAARQTGRQLKLMGSFYLLAGQWSHALLQFSEASVVLKRADDQLWLGNSLEGLAVAAYLLNYGPSLDTISTPLHPPAQLSVSVAALLIIQLSEGGSRSPRTSLSSNLAPVTDVEQLIFSSTEKALLAYDQSMIDFDDVVPDIVYAECILRRAAYLVNAYPLEITSLAPQPQSNAPQRSLILNQNRSRNSTSTFESKRSSTSSRSSGEIVTHLEISNVLHTINRIFLLLLEDLPTLVQSRIYCSLASLYSKLGLHRKRAFILRLLLVLVLPELQRQHFEDFVENGFEEILTELETTYAEESATWPQLQIPLIHLCIRISECISDLATSARLCSILLSKYTHCLTASDQIQIKSKFDSVVLLAQRLNIAVDSSYWDRNFVRSAQFIPSKSIDALLPFPDLKLQSSSSKDAVFNPYNKSQEVSGFNKDLIAIQGEVQHLKVTLQNPFKFEMELSLIQIELADGAELVTLAAKPMPTPVSLLPHIRGNIPQNQGRRITTFVSNTAPLLLAVPAESQKQFIVPFKVEKTGPMVIQLLKIGALHCQPQSFDIIDTPPIEIKVVKKQIKVALTNILLKNGWLMLLTGEKYHFSIQLTNQLEEEVNYLSFSFWDSTVDQASRALAAPGLIALEVYELEHQLLTKPFKVVNKKDINKIMGNSSLDLDFEVTARKGIRDLTIVLEYAHKNPENVQDFLKRITIPLQLTIIPGLEVIGWDIHVALEWTVQDFEQLQLAKKAIGQNHSKFCLFVLDIRNSYNQAIKAKLQYHWNHVEYEIQQKIPGNKTIRFFLPMEKISPDDLNLKERIPSLMKKQFVKNYSITDEEEERMRELFWLRENILERLTGSWSLQEEDGARHGIITLRSLKLTPQMASLLIEQSITLLHEVLEEDYSIVERNGIRYLLKTDQFYILRTRISNKSPAEVIGMLRHIPSIRDVAGSSSGGLSSPTKSTRLLVTIDRKILYNGVLQASIPKLQPGCEINIDLSFSILENGSYEWGSILDGTIQIGPREPLYIEACS